MPIMPYYYNKKNVIYSCFIIPATQQFIKAFLSKNGLTQIEDLFLHTNFF